MTLKKIIISMFLLFAPEFCRAQFLDSFDAKSIQGWFFFTGDGAAEMDFVQKDGYARFSIDATKDKYNVYWTLIKRDVTAFLDLGKMKDTSFQLRVEARVRVHDAPRRLNMMVNTQRTTNFHIDLMEFDIADTSDWHTFSMTTKKFDAVPGDTVYVQLAATDYGIGTYMIDVDYYRADIVDVRLAGPDKGNLVPYHPQVPDVKIFSNHLDAAHDCLINFDFPEVNFNTWKVKEQNGDVPVLTVNANQWAIVRWDFKKYKNKNIDGAGILELTTSSVPAGGRYIDAFGQDFGMEFGKIRVIEIIGGDPEWDQESVTLNTLLKGNPISEVFNSQMIYDFDVTEEPDGKNFITISKPVMQRLIEGKTKGLYLCPLGAIDASFYASESQPDHSGPKLHFNVLSQ